MWARLWLTATAAFISPPPNTEIKVGSTPTAHTRKNKTKEVDFMLYSEAIELLEDMASNRFTPIEQVVEMARKAGQQT